MVERPRSRTVTDGPERAPARAMLRAVGFSEEDFGKPQVGVASSWNEVTPCNYHLGKLAALAKEGVRQGDAVPMEFTTIAVSDGIAMGHEGMKASLISRDVIADSVELVMHAERFDGLVGIAGCDKSEPGMLMAMARLNLPSVYLYGGTILAGTYGGRDITIQDVFEAVGATPSCWASSAQRARRRARAPACTRRTRWPRRARRSACRSPAARARRPWTIGARCSRGSRASR
jgi:dihydroxy-acid dehydratase